MNICGVVEWGVVPYAQACGWQEELVRLRQRGEIPDLLIFCEHPHVITLGRNARRENIRLPEAELARRGVPLCGTKRGGDVTYHGPGQLVGYPILNLAGLRKDVVWYVRALEEVLIRAACEFGVEATRKTGAPVKPRPDGRGKRPLYTGVWVGSPESGDEKLAAIGVHIARWVTSHGFAFNVTTDLRYFDFIVPCGIADKRPTSLDRLLQPIPTAPSPQAPAWGDTNPSGGGRWARQIEKDLMTEVKAAAVRQFGVVFGRTMGVIESEQWEAWLGAQQAAAS